MIFVEVFKGVPSLELPDNFKLSNEFSLSLSLSSLSHYQNDLELRFTWSNLFGLFLNLVSFRNLKEKLFSFLSKKMFTYSESKFKTNTSAFFLLYSPLVAEI